MMCLNGYGKRIAVVAAVYDNTAAVVIRKIIQRERLAASCRRGIRQSDRARAACTQTKPGLIDVLAAGLEVDAALPSYRGVVLDRGLECIGYALGQCRRSEICAVGDRKVGKGLERRRAALTP